jgi:hypothetical protein
VPLLCHDEQPLPSRRALREAERARAAASAAPSSAVRATRRPAPAPVPPPTAPRRARAAVAPAPTRVPAPPRVPAPTPAPAPLTEHVLEGGDDAWVHDVAPRPTPVASRVVADALPAPVAVSPARSGAWRRLPQAVVVGSLVAATVAYATTGDTAATAGEVRAFERAEATVSAQAATPVAPWRTPPAWSWARTGCCASRATRPRAAQGGACSPAATACRPRRPSRTARSTRLPVHPVGRRDADPG